MLSSSFSGAGAALAPWLIVVSGTDRQRHESAAKVATYTGVAPVIQRSGKQQCVQYRRHGPKFLCQTLVEFAHNSIGFRQWVRIYYEEQRRRGKGPHAAVRALAFEWTRLLFRCWHDRVPYDEVKYLATLQRHRSWIANALKNNAA